MRATIGRRKVHLFAAALFAGSLLQFLTGSMAQVRVEESASLPAAPLARQSTTTDRAPALSPRSASVSLALAHRTTDAKHAGELFAPHSWYSPPPPPPPPAPAPVAAPVAPPLPYTLLGSYTDSDNSTVYFVAREDRVYDVKPGDVLDPTYSVAAVENGQLIFIYKPLNVRQPLPIGATP
ncbi:MAG TPA: hypothetical protein VH814_02905 [Steroidobacteraceae bacterium]|jgi:hypothetical protein